jgi:hypothetical protein
LKSEYDDRYIQGETKTSNDSDNNESIISELFLDYLYILEGTYYML